MSMDNLSPSPEERITLKRDSCSNCPNFKPYSENNNGQKGWCTRKKREVKRNQTCDKTGRSLIIYYLGKLFRKLKREIRRRWRKRFYETLFF